MILISIWLEVQRNSFSYNVLVSPFEVSSIYEFIKVYVKSFTIYGPEFSEDNG